MFWASRTQDYKKIQEKYLMIASLHPSVRFRFKIQLFYKRSVIEKSKLIKILIWQNLLIFQSILFSILINDK